MKSQINILIIVICGLALVVGCGGNTSADPASSNGEKASTEPPIAVQAKVLSKEYDDNELAADGKYRGKLLSVNGKITEIAETFGDITVSLEGHDALQTVMCTFVEAEKQKVATLKKGAQVTLIGIGDGSTAGLYVGLKKCRLP